MSGEQACEDSVESLRGLPGVPEVALCLRGVQDEGYRLHARPAALAAENVEIAHPAQQFRPGIRVDVGA